MIKKNYDVVVVGGGPAGSSAAYAAASRGASVIMLEKEADIAETVRTSGVSWLKEIKEFGIPRECYNEIRNFSFQSPNNTVTIKCAAPAAAVLDVRRTYRWLASQAGRAGAGIMTGTNITGVTRSKGRIAGVTGTCTADHCDVEFGAKVIVDATGFPSVVCRAVGMADQWQRFGVGAEYEVEAESVDPDTWWLMVGRRFSPAGYAWIFPVGGRVVRIGVGVGKPESDADPKQILKKIMDDREGPISSLGRIRPMEFHYGLIPNEGLSRRTVTDGLIAVGDSAGQANPLVLEGIRYAIQFGRMAGQRAADAARTGRTAKRDLYPYERQWRKMIESRIKIAQKVQNRWIHLSDEEWDRELDIIRGMTPQEIVRFVRAEFRMPDLVRMMMRSPGTAARQLFRMVGAR